METLLRCPMGFTEQNLPEGEMLVELTLCPKYMKEEDMEVDMEEYMSAGSPLSEVHYFLLDEP